MVSLAFEHDQLGVRDFLGEVVRRSPMGAIGRAMIFVVANEDERRRFDFLQALRVVVFLAREHEMQIFSNGAMPDMRTRRNVSIKSGGALTNSFVHPVSMVCSRI